MKYREQMVENFKDADKTMGNITATCVFAESLSAVTLWLIYGVLNAHGKADDDMVNVDDAINIITANISLEHMGLHFQLVGFISWLLDQECPEFDNERGAWCDPPIVFDKYNEWVAMRQEWNAESEGE